MWSYMQNQFLKGFSSTIQKNNDEYKKRFPVQ